VLIYISWDFLGDRYTPFSRYNRLSMSNRFDNRFNNRLYHVNGALKVTVRPTLPDFCPVCPLSLSVCNVGILRPNGWMDQDATW